MSKLKSKFATGSANDPIVLEVFAALSALMGFVLTTWTERGRKSTVLDQTVDRHFGGISTRVNRARSQRAKDAGQTGYTKATPIDVLKGIYQGNPEIGYTEIDAANLVDKLMRQAGNTTSLSLEQRIAVHDMLAEKYIDHPDAKKFITLDELTDEQVSTYDPPKPARNAGKPNGLAEATA
jgi:hypothetical protein